MSADLITFEEYLTMLGKSPGDVDTVEQAQIEAAIAGSSESIRSHTDRDFTLIDDAVQDPRQYRYDCSGILDIDDAAEVTAVDVVQTPWNSARTLDPAEWIAGPFNDPVLQYIEIWSRFVQGSPAMGFTRNLDNPLYPVGSGPLILSITGTWGWAEIPQDVKQAMLWTIESIRSDPSPYTSESIEGYSRTRRYASPVAIPDRAAALLDPYTRIVV